MGDFGGGLIEALVHIHFEAGFLDQIGGQMKGLGLAVEGDGEEKLAMEERAIGATAVGLAALTSAFDEGTGQHLTPGAQTANEPAAEEEIGVGWHLTLIIVSD